MCANNDISKKKSQALRDLQLELSKVKQLPVSIRSKELIGRINQAINDLESSEVEITSSCKCNSCEAAFLGASNEDDVIEEDSIIHEVYRNFTNPIKSILMNKKVIAGVLIISAVVLTVIGVKMWRKSAKAGANA